MTPFFQVLLLDNKYILNPCINIKITKDCLYCKLFKTDVTRHKRYFSAAKILRCHNSSVREVTVLPVPLTNDVTRIREKYLKTGVCSNQGFY